jgi:hypothetical protein
MWNIIKALYLFSRECFAKVLLHSTVARLDSTPSLFDQKTNGEPMNILPQID